MIIKQDFRVVETGSNTIKVPQSLESSSGRTGSSANIQEATKIMEDELRLKKEQLFKQLEDDFKMKQEQL
jgi:hypothetical protein